MANRCPTGDFFIPLALHRNRMSFFYIVGKFNWKGTIKAVLKQAPDNEVAVKKLRKKVWRTHPGREAGEGPFFILRCTVFGFCRFNLKFYTFVCISVIFKLLTSSSGLTAGNWAESHRTSLARTVPVLNLKMTVLGVSLSFAYSRAVVSSVFVSNSVSVWHTPSGALLRSVQVSECPQAEHTCAANTGSFWVKERTF